MARSVREKKIETVFVWVLFSVFAASLLLVLMLGGTIYMGVTERSKQGWEERTCLSYIWTKVKHNDAYTHVQVSDFNGLSALRLDEDYNGTQYNTWIYLYDGWVCELYCEAGLTLPPVSGNPIVKTDSLSFTTLAHGLIEVTAESNRLLIAPRGKGGIVID